MKLLKVNDEYYIPIDSIAEIRIFYSDSYISGYEWFISLGHHRDELAYKTKPEALKALKFLVDQFPATTSDEIKVETFDSICKDRKHDKST